MSKYIVELIQSGPDRYICWGLGLDADNNWRKSGSRNSHRFATKSAARIAFDLFIQTVSNPGEWKGYLKVAPPEKTYEESFAEFIDLTEEDKNESLT